MRKQEENEPVDALTTYLYALAEYCSYGPLHDDMIRDHIVVGLRDVKLSENNLTLDKVVTQVRQAEEVKKQQTVISSEGEPVPLGVSKRGSQTKHSSTNPEKE